MISIFLPVHGGIEFIDESVQSVLSQTYSDWELFIGVNGFQKNSNEYQIACKYASDKIHIEDQFYIRSKAESLNHLLSVSRGEHIALIDVDDIWLPNKLERQMLFINEYDVVGCCAIVFGNQTGTLAPAIGDVSNYDYSYGNPLVNSAVLMRREGVYWRDIIFNDYDLWYRMAVMNKRLFNMQDLLVKYRIRDGSECSRLEEGEKSVQYTRSFYAGLR